MFTKLGLPVFALGMLAITRQLTGALVVAALVGMLALLVSIALLGLLLRREALARRIGGGLGRVVSWVRRLAHRQPVMGWGDAAVRFRMQTIELVAGRWPWLTLTTVASHLALSLVLLFSLRSVGVSEAWESPSTT